MRIETLEARKLMTADPIHVGVVYLETDYLETDNDGGNDSQPDRFILSFTGGAPDTQLTQLRITTDKDGDGISVGDPIYDSESGGRGKNGFHPFEVHATQSQRNLPIDVDATVSDGGQELVLDLRGFFAGDRLEFTLDVDEVLRNSPSLTLAEFNQRLDVITSGQEFQDSILQAAFSAPDYLDSSTDALFVNDFGDPASQFGLDLPPDDSNDIDSRPNRSAAAVGSVVQEPEPASLSGHVYRDDNDSGTRDPGEIGLGGVRVRIEPLETIAPQTTLVTTTDASGAYRFTGLMPGRYRVIEVDQPDGLWDGRDAAGTIDGRVVGTAINPGDLIDQVTLRGGDAGVDYDFGELPPGRISGSVYLAAPGRDCTGDHGADDATPLVDVEILLQDDSGQTVATTRTNADGRYEFLNLPAGLYQVIEITPANLIDGGAFAGRIRTLQGDVLIGVGTVVDGGRITDVTLGAGDDGTEYDFCEAAPASLSGHVYEDTNDNGRRETGEAPIPDATVTLVDSNGTVVGTTQTDDQGHYEFLGLPAGVYRVVESQPSGYLDGKDAVGTISGAFVGQLGADRDSIVEIDLRQGLSGINYDFGELLPGSISGRVHVDLDEDCVLDPGEVTLGGVRIDLLDQNDNLIRSTTTADDGTYRFDGLPPGVYSVVETQPVGYLQGGAVVGSAGGRVEGPDRIDGIELVSGQSSTANDFCERPPASISGVVFIDQDDDCIQDSGEVGLDGVLVELFDADGKLVASTRTDANGQYRFDDLPAGVYTVVEEQPQGYFHGGQVAGSAGGNDASADVISQIPVGWGETLVQYNFCENLPASLEGVVFVDRDDDCIQDSGEVGLGGVTIELFDDGGNLVATTQTLADGTYSFQNLRPGVYTVRESQPAGYFQGGQVAGSAGGDDSATDVISAIPVGAGDQLTQYNFCERLGVSLAGYVWEDVIRNGQFDPSERGLADVEIALRDASGATVQTTTTRNGGRYEFNDLEPGTYAVVETQPEGYFHGGQIVGDHGGVIAADDHLAEITLRSGDNADQYNFPEIPPATISGYVFQDGAPIVTDAPPPAEDLRDFRDGLLTNDDVRLAGVQLTLRDTSGLPIEGPDRILPGHSIVTSTDANGYYEFTGINPVETFFAVYQSQPETHVDSLDTPGTTGGFGINQADLSNSDVQFVVNQLSNNPETDPQFDAIFRLTLRPGQVSLSNNFSEILIEEPPVLPPPEDPEEDPIPRVTTPIPTFDSQPRLVALPEYRDVPRVVEAVDEWAVSWHLSVINGGNPRGDAMILVEKSDKPTVQAVGYRASFLPSRTSASELARQALKVDLKNGRWQVLRSDAMGTDDSEEGRMDTWLTQFGHVDATALAGDFDGDGSDEPVLFLGGQWFVDFNGNGVWDRGDLWVRLGTELDRPVVGDWDGDGKDDVGIFGRRWQHDEQRIRRDPGLPDPANQRRRRLEREDLVHREASEADRRQRVLRRGDEGHLQADAVDHVFQYGEQVDTPISGDWNGDGIDQIGVYRSGQWLLDEDADGRWTKHSKPHSFGEPGDEPVVGDFNGDGIDEIAVVRGDVWIIDSDGDRRLTGNDRRVSVPRDSAGDQPVAGDFDGDGKDDPGYYYTGQTPSSRHRGGGYEAAG
ncbi:MAG: SdrD B-like domain-containing protein [Planctomycetota bacterium]